LRREYYAAARSPYLSSEFLDRVKPAIDEEWERQEAGLAKLRKSLAKRSEEERAARLYEEPSMQEIREWNASPEGRAWRAGIRALKKRRRGERARFSSQEEYDEWQAKHAADRKAKYRASLSLEGLVKLRIRRIVSCVVADLPEEASRLGELPLRDWFIPDARAKRMRLHQSGREVR
jgi:hypothetical protein